MIEAGTRARVAVLAGALALVAVGCGATGEPTCDVHGQVTYQGEPLTDAVISFFPTTGRPIGGPLDAEGRYQIELPSGEYAVIVNAASPLPDGWQEGDPLPPQRPRIPPRYAQKERSGLGATVPSGSSELAIDFPLK